MSEKHSKSSKKSLSYNKEEDTLARHDEEHKKRGEGGEINATEEVQRGTRLSDLRVRQPLKIQLLGSLLDGSIARHVMGAHAGVGGS